MTKKLKMILLNCLLISGLLSAQSYEWGGTFGGNGEDAVIGMTVDQAGNVYTTGYFTFDCDFDIGPNNFMIAADMDYQIFVQKTDAAGNFIWAKSVGGIVDDNGTKITTDTAGNVYITGVYGNTVDFDPGAGEFFLTSAGGLDIFILKLDPNGNFVWAKSIGGTDYEESNGIGTDAAGNVYISGYFYNAVDFNPGPGVYTMVQAGEIGNGDGFVVKLSTAGEFVWAKRYGGVDFDLALDMQVQNNGDLYISGNFRGTADFNPDANATFLLTTPQYTDSGFLLHLNSDGNFVKAVKTGQGTNEMYGIGVAADSNGDAYVTGFFGGSMDFQMENGTTTTLVSEDFYGCYIAKINANGTIAWVRQPMSPTLVVGYDIVVNSQHEVIVTGYFDTSIQFGTLHVNQNSATAQETFVTKLDTNGNFLSAYGFGGINFMDRCSVAVGPNDSIYLSGAYEQTVNINPIPGQLTSATSVGFRDNYLIKMSNSTLSVPEIIAGKNLNLYPNPTTGLVYVKSATPLTATEFSVLDSTGRVVQHGTLAVEQSIDLQSFSKGTYILTLDQNSYKIIKE